MESKNAIYKLAEKYEPYPLIRALIQLIPFGIGSAVDTYVMARVAQIRTERLRAFFDTLSKHALITEEMIDSEDFLHAYFATARAALNTRRRDKIRLFARLLGNAFVEDKEVGIDVYEELLCILDELSVRELQILAVLDKYWNHSTFIDCERRSEMANLFWDDFIQEVENKLNISPEELNAILIRLTRSGCYILLRVETVVVTGIVTLTTYEKTEGELTPLYSKLRALIGSELNLSLNTGESKEYRCGD